ncbi:MAG TPA: hypothetical protein VGF64_06895 [Acidimicrobiales bacterium]
MSGFRCTKPPSAACQASMAWTLGPVFGSPRAARSALEKSDGVRMAPFDADEVPDGDELPDGPEVADGEAASDAGSRGGAQIHMPLPTGTGPLTAGMTGVGWAGAAGAAGPGAVGAGAVGAGPVGAGPVGVGTGGAVGTMPGRLCRGWGRAPVGGMEAAGCGDPEVGPLRAGGAAVVGGRAAVVGGGATVVEGAVVAGDVGCGAVVADGFGGAGFVVGVTGAGGLESVGGVGGQVFPPVTVTSLSVRLTLAAQVHKLQASLPCPAMVAPLPFTVVWLVATGRPLPLAPVPSVGTT